MLTMLIVSIRKYSGVVFILKYNYKNNPLFIHNNNELSGDFKEQIILICELSNNFVFKERLITILSLLTIHMNIKL